MPHESQQARLRGSTPRYHPIRHKTFLIQALLGIYFFSAPVQCDEISKGFYLNAYLTQGWGITDGVPILGLDEDGRFDYRSAALLFRYELSKKDTLVFQLAHEDLGQSAFDAFRDDKVFLRGPLFRGHVLHRAVGEVAQIVVAIG